MDPVAKPKSKSGFIEFTQGTSLHGVKHVTDDTFRGYKRFMWFILVVVMTVLMAIQVTQKVQDFLRKPLATHIKTEAMDEIVFPAVAICNINQYKISKLSDTIYKPVSDIFKTITPTLNIALEPFADVLNKANLTESLRFHTEAASALEDILLECYWPDGQRCNADDFKLTPTDGGICYVINGESNPPFVASKSGTGASLNFMLNIETYERMNGPGNTDGIKIVVFDRENIPVTDGMSIEAPPGFRSNIGIKKEVRNLIQTEDSEACHDDNPKYTFERCQQSAKWAHVRKQCGCNAYHAPRVVCDHDTGIGCDDTNQLDVCTTVKHFECVIQNMAAAPTLNCPENCTSTTYQTSLSISKLPTTFVDGVISNETLTKIEDNLLAALEARARVDLKQVLELSALFNGIDAIKIKLENLIPNLGNDLGSGLGQLGDLNCVKELGNILTDIPGLSSAKRLLNNKSPTNISNAVVLKALFTTTSSLVPDLVDTLDLTTHLSKLETTYSDLIEKYTASFDELFPSFTSMLSLFDKKSSQPTKSSEPIINDWTNVANAIDQYNKKTITKLQLAKIVGESPDLLAGVQSVFDKTLGLLDLFDQPWFDEIPNKFGPLINTINNADDVLLNLLMMGNNLNLPNMLDVSDMGIENVEDCESGIIRVCGFTKDLDLPLIPKLDNITGIAKDLDLPLIPKLGNITGIIKDLDLPLIPNLDNITGIVKDLDLPLIPKLDNITGIVKDLDLPLVPKLDNITGIVKDFDLPLIPKLNNITGIVKDLDLPLIPKLDNITGIVKNLDLPLVPKLDNIPGIVKDSDLPLIPKLDTITGIVKDLDLPLVPKLDNITGIVKDLDLPLIPKLDNITDIVKDLDLPLIPKLDDITGIGLDNITIIVKELDLPLVPKLDNITGIVKDLDLPLIPKLNNITDIVKDLDLPLIPKLDNITGIVEDLDLPLIPKLDNITSIVKDLDLPLVPKLDNVTGIVKDLDLPPIPGLSDVTNILGKLGVRNKRSVTGLGNLLKLPMNHDYFKNCGLNLKDLVATQCKLQTDTIDVKSLMEKASSCIHGDITTLANKYREAKNELKAAISPLTEGLVNVLKKFTGKTQIDEQFYEKNIVAVTLYYQQLTVEQYTQERTYDFFSLMCDIGGTMGLFLGASILTIIELAEFLFVRPFCCGKKSAVATTPQLKTVQELGTPYDLENNQISDYVAYAVPHY